MTARSYCRLAALPLKKSEFLAKAWKLANAKARELGWIV
jgi:hypothetical protein